MSPAIEGAVRASSTLIPPSEARSVQPPNVVLAAVLTGAANVAGGERLRTYSATEPLRDRMPAPKAETNSLPPVAAAQASTVDRALIAVRNTAAHLCSTVASSCTRISDRISGLDRSVSVGCAGGFSQTTRRDYFSLLHHWAERPLPGEQRHGAVERIKAFVEVPSSHASLDLSELSLKAVPPLPLDVRRLDVSNNRLAMLANLNLASLVELRCEHNLLGELPPDLLSLKVLVCHHNPLTELPPLPNHLERLNIANTWIDDISDLPRDLRFLNAADCRITSAPQAWPDNLMILSLRGNQLASCPALPESLLQCDLRDNQLTRLPPNADELMQVGQLKDFRIDRNPLGGRGSPAELRVD